MHRHRASVRALARHSLGPVRPRGGPELGRSAPLHAQPGLRGLGPVASPGRSVAEPHVLELHGLSGPLRAGSGRAPAALPAHSAARLGLCLCFTIGCLGQQIQEMLVDDEEHLRGRLPDSPVDLRRNSGAGRRLLPLSAPGVLRRARFVVPSWLRTNTRHPTRIKHGSR